MPLPNLRASPQPHGLLPFPPQLNVSLSFGFVPHDFFFSKCEEWMVTLITWIFYFSLTLIVATTLTSIECCWWCTPQHPTWILCLTSAAATTTVVLGPAFCKRSSGGAAPQLCYNDDATPSRPRRAESSYTYAISAGPSCGSGASKSPSDCPPNFRTSLLECCQHNTTRKCNRNQCNGSLCTCGSIHTHPSAAAKDTYSRTDCRWQ